MQTVLVSKTTADKTLSFSEDKLIAHKTTNDCQSKQNQEHRCAASTIAIIIIFLLLWFFFLLWGSVNLWWSCWSSSCLNRGSPFLRSCLLLLLLLLRLFLFSLPLLFFFELLSLEFSDSQFFLFLLSLLFQFKSFQAFPFKRLFS